MKKFINNMSDFFDMIGSIAKRQTALQKERKPSFQTIYCAPKASTATNSCHVYMDKRG